MNLHTPDCIKVLLLIAALFLANMANGKEVPRIINFNKSQYQASNQNWAISQGPEGRIFVGNSSGLLVFDGVWWKKLSLPNDEIVRSVYADTSGRVFTGGFAEVGYWTRNDWGEWQYHSLTEKIPDFENEEIWHFLEWKGKIYFQSFSRLYSYEKDSITAVNIPGNIMFVRALDDQLLVPVINEGLYLSGSNADLQKIPGSEIFAEQRVAAILPTDHPQVQLICTQSHGIFKYANGSFKAWHSPVNAACKTFQLNKAIRLKNGNYVFGTILNGLYITSPEGEIIYHLNQENGLQNNTILTLTEDNNQHFWVGMDKGIDLVDINSPLRYFQQKAGSIGAVYAAAVYRSRLYVGTNQGLYYKTWPTQQHENFTLLEGTKGQIWNLQLIDDQLFGAHNSGLFVINDQGLRFLYDQTGCYHILNHPGHSDMILAGTYTGIIVIHKNQNGEWAFGNELEGVEWPSRKLIIDQSENIWAAHPHRGLLRLKSDDSFMQSVETSFINAERGIPKNARVDISLWGQQVIANVDSSFYLYRPATGYFSPAQPADAVPFTHGDYKIIVVENKEWFEVYANKVIWHPEKDNEENQAPIHLWVSLLTRSESIVNLNDSLYLFCLDDGYALFNTQQTTAEASQQIDALIHQVDGFDQKAVKVAGRKKLTLSGKQLRFSFAAPQFTRNVKLQYRLKGFDNRWSPLLYKYSCEYTNLSPGDYQFQVRTANSLTPATLDFTVKPQWYQSWWALILLTLVVIVVAGLLIKWHYSRLNRQIRKLNLEKKRDLQRQQMEIKNERLQSEIQLKSRQLADSTLNLVRKNEILMHIKDELGTIRRQSGESRSVLKLSRSIDHHLTSEEDWKMFENYFNEVHEQFFKRLKTQFPDLTPGDLRLAAYLKMNLASKEIAPLLNISLRGVENKRYRLRRKIGLEQDVNLTDFLINY